MLSSGVVAGLPTSRHGCALSLGALVLMLASCEGRPLPSQDDGVGFGEEWGDGDGDPSSGDGDGDPSSGDGDPGSGDSGPVECVSVVDDLLISDSTDPASVDCVEQVEGDLTIGPTTQLVDLSMLGNLREVGGTIYVFGNLSLESLHGLELLESVDWLHVRRNHNLDDLHGLTSLTWVDHVTITNNAGMTSVAGLPSGLSPTVLEIGDNDLLADLDGLPLFLNPGNGEAIHVEIEDNQALADLGGLSDCCSSQAISLVLDGNASLVDLGGLESFVRLETLRLHDNFALETLAGLDGVLEIETLDVRYDHCTPGDVASLVSLGGAPALGNIDVLQIQWASSLPSLAGLDGIGALSKLVVRNNEALPWTDVEALTAQTGPGVVDTCGGVGGPTCSPEPCPMF